MSATLSSARKDVSRQASEAVVGLAHDAVRWVLNEIYRHHAQVLAVRGARGRYHTEQDLNYHVEFLSGALATEAPVFFTDYVRWLATVLKTRGVPVQMLDQSLQLLERFFEKSLQPQINDCVSEMLKQGRRALSDTGKQDRAPYCARRLADLPHVGALTQCLIEGDAQSARSLMQLSWQSSGSYVEVATRLFQPALYNIGSAWERNEISVAQEHLAASICQTLLTELYLIAGVFTTPIERTAVFAGIEGNQHILGLRMVSDAFELAGWQVLYLGANTPTDALVAMVDSTSPEIVGISASMVQHLPPMLRTVQAIKAELGSRCPHILIGGLPTNQLDEIWRWIGADAWSPDAAKAVKEMT